jgi:hypothetical protein
MSEVAKKILERSSQGDYQFTPYGEFLSYYHAHLQIFNKFITDKQIPQKDKDDLYNRIKGFMVTNIKKSDHFFEKIQEFSTFLQIDRNTLQTYLNQHFVDILNKVQDKLKEQELEKLSSKKDFAHITDELIYKLGEIFPAGHRFVSQEGVIVLQNTATGESYKPQGLMGAIQEAQQKEQEKLAARVVSKPKEPEFKPETSILQEILDLYGDILLGEKLELKEEIVEAPAPEPEVKPEPPKEKGLLDDVADLEFHEDTNPNQKGLLDDIDDLNTKMNLPSYGNTQVNIPSFNSGNTQINMPAYDSGPGLLDDIEEPESNTDPLADISDLLSTKPSAVVPEEPDEADKFTYKQFAEITKTIQTYKSANDVNGYNQWMTQTGDLEKSFVSIRTNLSKEASGQPVDWNKFYETVASKTKLKVKTLEKLKNRIKHLELTKTYLDISAKELKNLSPDILNLVKSAWPHIITCFGDAPEYSQVETKLQSLLSKIKSDSQRQPIQKILNQAIQKLKQKL